MKRLIKHFESTFESNPIHMLVPDFGESNTDKSFFRPDISQTRAFLGSQMGSNRVGLYDFPDGKDTGETAQTVIRSKGLDITEVDALIQKHKAKMELDIAQQKADKEIAQDKEVLAVMRQNIADVAQASKTSKFSKTAQAPEG